MPLPPELQNRPFSVAEARSRGAGRARRSPAPFRGVRSPVEPTTATELCRAYAPRLLPGQYFSHLSAALLFGMPVPRHLDRPGAVHVAAVAPAFPPQARGVTGHQLPSGTATLIHRGLPVVHPALAWLQLASVLDHDDLVVAGDFLVRRKGALSSLAELRDLSRRRMPGIRRARAALLEVRASTDSPQESRTRLALVRAGLAEPLVGFVVRDAGGDFVATPDLAYPDERVAIEYQGSDHWTDPRVFAADIARREALTAVGWAVVEVIAEHLTVKRPLLIARVQAALSR